MDYYYQPLWLAKTRVKLKIYHSLQTLEFFHLTLISPQKNMIFLSSTLLYFSRHFNQQQQVLQNIQMLQGSQFDKTIESIDQQTKFIEGNRADRNKRYKQCMSGFKEFLKMETRQLEETETDNNQNKELISMAFENTFERVLNASDLTIRKIKQTFNQKKIFWDNVIKMNADISDIELKKQFYLQKRSSEQGYLEAVDRQKDKHKTYKALISTEKKKEQLREYQQSNKLFEEKVVQGSNTLNQWQNISNNNVATNKYNSYSYQPETRAVINQFVHPNYYKSSQEEQGYGRPISSEAENSTVFINNFQKKR